jgi:hypothetical protein
MERARRRPEAGRLIALECGLFTENDGATASTHVAPSLCSSAVGDQPPYSPFTVFQFTTFQNAPT